MYIDLDIDLGPPLSLPSSPSHTLSCTCYDCSSCSQDVVPIELVFATASERICELSHYRLKLRAGRHITSVAEVFRFLSVPALGSGFGSIFSLILAPAQ